MKKILSFGAIIIVGIFIGIYFQPLLSNPNVFDQEKKITDVLNKIAKNYVTDVDKGKLAEAAIRGMLEELDPHSVYITADEMKGVTEDFRGSFDGIGIEFEIINDSITVVTAISGGPSELLGIQSGDKIVRIDDSNAVGLTNADVPKKLKGPKGTKVIVDIKRGGMKDLLHYEIIRDKIPLYSVDASYLIDKSDVGVIVLSRFIATSQTEVMQAIQQLRQQGMKKLILDLRYNPGGYLNQAFMIADDFLPGGDTIVYTLGRKQENNEVFRSTNGGICEDLPLIVMVNAGSASASEIVSGAIQDLGRGLIVGETSFGKGLVQRQIELDDGSAIRLTISKYYTPSGRCIQRPYGDKDKYRHLAGRFEPEEGSYIDNGLEKIKAQVEKLNKEEKDPKKRINIDSLPLFTTKNGRTVFGGGGITPDYIIKQDTITKLSVNIRIKNLYFEFVNNYLSNKGNYVKDKYKDNFENFYRNYKVENSTIEDFKKFVESKDIKWSDEDYKTDEDFIKTSIKATIAKVMWDRTKQYEIYYNLDRQLTKAVSLFSEINKITKKKK